MIDHDDEDVEEERGVVLLMIVMIVVVVVVLVLMAMIVIWLYCWRASYLFRTKTYTAVHGRGAFCVVDVYS